MATELSLPMRVATVVRVEGSWSCLPVLLYACCAQHRAGNIVGASHLLMEAS